MSSTNWLTLLILLFCCSGCPKAISSTQSDAIPPHLQLSILEPQHQLFAPGDELVLTFALSELGSLATGNFSLEVLLPESALLTDTLWNTENNLAVRKLTKPTGADTLLIDLGIRINSDFKGSQLSFQANYANYPKARDTLTINVDTAARMAWVPSDTILVQATEEEVQIVGSRDLMGLQQTNLKITILTSLKLSSPDARDSLVAIAYWIGIGEQPIADYLALAEKVPPEWGQPYISLPLAAFGLGHPIELPELGVSDDVFQRNSVRFDFVAEKDRQVFPQGQEVTPLILRNPQRPNYGLVQGSDLQALASAKLDDPDDGEVLRFYFAATNQHQLNTYRIQLKVVAYYEVKRQVLVQPQSNRKP